MTLKGKLLYNITKPFFVLAPMDDVTDTVFRQVVACCAAPDLFFTEFVNVDGLQSPGRQKLLHKLNYSDIEKPIIAQIWGLNPINFYKTAKEITSMGFTGVDLNMGCPDKTVVKNGACSALIKNKSLASEIIKATREGAGQELSISVKTRLGFNTIDYSWLEFLLKHNLDMLTIHGRTRLQMSKVPNNWQAISQIKMMKDRLSPKTLIVGNGDVVNRRQGEELAKQYKLDGIMIGRGIFNNPYVFTENNSWNQQTMNQKIDLYLKHIKLFATIYNNQEKSVKTLNKFCKIYINGFEGAKEVREELMKASTTEELIDQLNCLR